MWQRIPALLDWIKEAIVGGEQEQLTHWKRPWCWERLKGGEEGDRGWDGWMASLTQQTWTWANSGRWWGVGKPGELWSMGLQSQTQLGDWTTTIRTTKHELHCILTHFYLFPFFPVEERPKAQPPPELLVSFPPISSGTFTHQSSALHPITLTLSPSCMHACSVAQPCLTFLQPHEL